jgi:hypothetical protein
MSPFFSNCWLLCFAFFLVNLAHAQNDNESFLKFQELYHEANHTMGDSSCQLVHLDSLHQIIFSTNKAELRIDSSSKWQLLFGYRDGWEQIVHHEARPRFPNDSLGRRKLRYICDDLKVYSSQQLIETLSIHRNFLVAQTHEIKHFPIIFGRNDPLNTVFTPILSGDYLLIRYVHSYPHGNMTSFYSESMLYFRRQQ